MIKRVLGRDIMQESVTYQAIKAEGSQEKARQVAIALLQEGMEMATIARIVSLSVEEVQQLAQEAENSD